MRSGRSKLCAKLTSSFLRKWWFVIFVSLVLVLLGAIIFIFFSQWVNLYINSELVLRNESMTFGWWRKPPVKPLMKVYVYNVTNADGFLNNGEKPVLNELGPYVYVQSWEKVNLAFNKNHTITFNQHKEFVFDRNQSVGDEDDLVVVPNIPMLSATSQSKHAARFLRLAMASIMDILKVKPFVEVSVHQLLWGYEDPLLKLAKDVVPKEQKLPYEEFGLMYGLKKLSEALGITSVTELLDALNLEDVLEFALAGLDAIFNRPDNGSPPHHIIRIPSISGRSRQNGPGRFGFFKAKNGTSRDKVTVFTGGSNIEQYGVIDRFNGNKSLLHWKTEQCNRLNGSDGSIFPPHITKNTTLFVYDKDLCRLLPLSYQKDVETANGVIGYRFTPPKDVFADVSTKPENECFCPGGPPCAPNGFFNVSLCQYDSPILLSFPHFYLADEKYRLAVEGVSPPVADKHEFFLDVQPQMGVSLRARARVQINLAVSQVVDIKQVATFPDIVFPIMWFEDGIDALPAEVTDMLNFATRVPPVAKACLSYGLFVAGGLLLLLAVICLVRNSGRQETLHLEGTSHYVKPDKTASGNGHSNGKSKTLETLNPSFLNGPDHPNTN